MAASITGPQIYPPVPITKSGLKSFRIFIDSPIPAYVSKIAFTFFNVNFLNNFPVLIWTISKPAFFTNLFSRPFLVPINKNSESFSFFCIILAIAIAGFTCPPVPAQANITHT